MNPNYAFWLPKDMHDKYGRPILFCGSQNILLIAAKEKLHREILLEKNINEDIFQWILGYPRTVKPIADRCGGMPTECVTNTQNLS